MIFPNKHYDPQQNSNLDVLNSNFWKMLLVSQNNAE